jgi:protein-disulfide isomerase
VNIKDVDTKGEPFIGKTDAPVTLAYWLDFQCPFCQRFDLQTLPVLVEKYVNTGKLKVVFKDFQFLSEDSQTGGFAAHAVWELYPAKYFEWHTAMFEAQDEEHGGFGDKASIIALTRKISGIDADAVSRLMDQKNAEYQAEQDADKAEGAKFGVQGTPGFILGTQRVSGAQPIEVFSQLIDAELGKIKK